MECLNVRNLYLCGKPVLDPVLPLSPGRAERHGFEYFRHGTLSLYAALDTRTGDVLGKTAAKTSVTLPPLPLKIPGRD
jgi:hypothetical protein